MAQQMITLPSARKLDIHVWSFNFRSRGLFSFEGYRLMKAARLFSYPYNLWNVLTFSWIVWMAGLVDLGDLDIASQIIILCLRVLSLGCFGAQYHRIDDCGNATRTKIPLSECVHTFRAVVLSGSPIHGGGSCSRCFTLTTTSFRACPPSCGRVGSRNHTVAVGHHCSHCGRHGRDTPHDK